MTVPDDRKLIRVLRQGGRHGDLRLCRYEESHDEEEDAQFAAVTFELGEREYYIAFRGTDNSVVGWKEDLTLSFKREIPSQRRALAYALETMKRFPGKYFLGGHSKGGNLAVYCAMKLPEEQQRGLMGVFNHDGPGFSEEIYQSGAYANIRSLIQKTIPQVSFVGLMWEGDNNYSVVCSRAGVWKQHDPYTWEVTEDSFRQTEEPDALSQRANRIVMTWLSGLSPEERRRIIEGIFNAISDTGIRMFFEMTDHTAQKIRRLLGNVVRMDTAEKKLIFLAACRFAVAAVGELGRAFREDGSEDTGDAGTQ